MASIATITLATPGRDLNNIRYTNSKTLVFTLTGQNLDQLQYADIEVIPAMATSEFEFDYTVNNGTVTVTFVEEITAETGVEVYIASDYFAASVTCPKYNVKTVTNALPAYTPAANASAAPVASPVQVLFDEEVYCTGFPYSSNNGISTWT